jgi:hypothetical protein
MGMASAQVGSPMSQNQSSGKGTATVPMPGSIPGMGMGGRTMTGTAQEPELGSELATTDIREQPQRQVLPAMIQPAGGQNGQYQPSGKGGNVTFPGQSGQPRFGQPNNYSNTVGPWDNANIQPRQTQSGKGKGY